jgi:hypothetical protein
MTRMRATIGIAAALLLLAACAGGDRPVADTQASGGAAAGVERARAAATLANAMTANPSRADSLLSAAGYTVESFERLMYEIAADSAQAAAYAAARTD